MKKIFRTLVTIIVTSLPSHLAASAEAFDETVSTSDSMIAQDIEILRPCYEAIKQIRITLEAITRPLEYPTGFTSCWPCPNPFYSRTPKYLFLETTALWGEKIPFRLYTPFGEVHLLSSSVPSKLITISKKFLASMDWDIEDVTDRVHTYSYRQDTNTKYGPFSFHKKRWDKGLIPIKLYLIKRVHSVIFHPESADAEELILLSAFDLAAGQYEKDKEQFNLLSAGKKCF